MNLKHTRAERGVALVITLIMLSVVTITAVAFLAVARREKVAVNLASEGEDARLLGEIAFNRGKAAILAPVLLSSNWTAARYGVSTTFHRPFLTPAELATSAADFTDFDFFTNVQTRWLTNVSYFKNAEGRPWNLGDPADAALYRAMLANLYYDPRPPVSVQTNRSGSIVARQDFRFYLDLNRNGIFDTNGFIFPRNSDFSTNGYAPDWFYGDPEWIGVLEHPDKPHSGRNRFIGRIAYVVVPASRTLDINYAGNLASKGGRGGGASYRRNEGVGSWEFNLGAFFRDLNTNIWRKADYTYSTTAQNSGRAFTQAADQIVSWRAQDPNQSLLSFVKANTDLANPNIPDALFHGADYYSDGPIKQTNLFAAYVNNTQKDKAATLGWPGADPRRQVKLITDELLGANIWNGNVTGNTTPFSLANIAPSRNDFNNTYQQYTFYRALAQLGTDTGDGRIESGVEVGGHFYIRPKLNINFDQDDPDGQYANSAEPSFTGAPASNGNTFRHWTPAKWMNFAVDRMLRTEFTNGLTRWRSLTNTDRLIGTNRFDDSPLGFPLIVFTPTNPPGYSGKILRQVNNYSGQVHRMAQLAANIYDASTNRSGTVYPFLPSVFRPLVYRDWVTPIVYTTNKTTGTVTLSTNSANSYLALRLFGYEEVTGTNLFRSLYSDPWVDITTYDSLYTNKFISWRDDIFPIAGISKSPAIVNTNAMRVNVAGLPWVIGAKKGFPAFDESFSQTEAQVTRRFFVTKPAGRLLKTNQTAFDFDVKVSYLFTVTNTFGADAWNSYAANFPTDRPLRIFATNIIDFAILDSSQTNFTSQPLGRPLVVNYYKNGRFFAFTNTVHVTATNIIDIGASFPANSVWPGTGNRTLNSYMAAISNSLVTSFYFNPVTGQTFDGSGLYEAALVPATTAPPKIAVAVTNRLVMAIIDTSRASDNRLVDLVNLKSITIETNIIPFLARSAASTGVNSNALTMPDFWNTNITARPGVLWGLSNQVSVSSAAAGFPQTTFWTDPPLVNSSVADARASFYYFLYGFLPANAVGKVQFSQFVTNGTATAVRFQSGFSPSASVVLTDRRMANDPLVHYTMDDLGPGATIATAARINASTLVPFVGAYMPAGLYTNISGGDGRLLANQIGTRKSIFMYAPWGTNWTLPWNAGTASGAFDPGYKDPLIRSSDDWAFPTNFFDTLGEIGRVHRGTPWQTVYLKSIAPSNAPGNFVNRYFGKQLTWAAWSGHEGTHPTNDWKLLQLFTTAINDNAARGLMSVNQTNIAAWSALLSGTPVLRANGTPTVIEPASPELYAIMGGTLPANRPTNGVVPMQAATPTKSFNHLGDIFSVPTLSVASPFVPAWNLTTTPMAVRDDVVERIPQQILPLLREDEPRFVIYSFAQTLKPAPGAIYTGPDKFFGLCTNYVVTGEYATKTVLRFDGRPIRSEIRPVVESHEVLASPSSN